MIDDGREMRSVVCIIRVRGTCINVDTDVAREIFAIVLFEKVVDLCAWIAAVFVLSLFVDVVIIVLVV